MALIVEEIWKEYRSKLLRFIESRIGNPDTAEDIIQDVFVKISQNIDKLHSEDKLRGWLYQIARNAVIDHYRTQKPLDELPDLPQQTDESSAEAVKELSACLLPMINKLPAHYRESIILSEMEGIPHKEISRFLRISPSGSKSRVQRGRALLKEMLMDCCRIEFDHRGQIFDYEQNRNSCDNCR